MSSELLPINTYFRGDGFYIETLPNGEVEFVDMPFDPNCNNKIEADRQSKSTESTAEDK